MQEIHFEATIRDGYIKIPKQYARLNNKRVLVDITNQETRLNRKDERIKNAEAFLRKCSGILKNTQIPADITKEQIREMRLKEKYGL